MAGHGYAQTGFTLEVRGVQYDDLVQNSRKQIKRLCVGVCYWGKWFQRSLKSESVQGKSGMSVLGQLQQVPQVGIISQEPIR